MREKNRCNGRPRGRYPHTVTTENLGHDGVLLTSFYFRYGANIYVFTYEKNGSRKHTFIDTGYADHQESIFPILRKNGIRLGNIENIIITHRHPDHCGLVAPLAELSGCRIMAHAGFKDFVNGSISVMEKRWLGKFDPTRMAEHDMVYLRPGNPGGAITIGGMDFPRMGPGMDITGGCRLEIITCPETTPTHSPDQLLVLYSPRRTPYICDADDSPFLPTDEIIFSGDLWLMRGPIFERSLRSLKMSLRFALLRLMARLSRQEFSRPVPQEQDAAAKDAIKKGFCLIRVKPGHGREFLGSNLIPNTLMADRDLLLHLGYGMDEDKAVLKSDSLKKKIAALHEKAFQEFVDTLKTWRNLGYTENDIAGLIVRLYLEQSGGGKLVAQDRNERRARLKNTLKNLSRGGKAPEDLRQIAAYTLTRLGKA